MKTKILTYPEYVRTQNEEFNPAITAFNLIQQLNDLAESQTGLKRPLEDIIRDINNVITDNPEVLNIKMPIERAEYLDNNPNPMSRYTAGNKGGNTILLGSVHLFKI